MVFNLTVNKQNEIVIPKWFWAVLIGAVAWAFQLNSNVVQIKTTLDNISAATIHHDDIIDANSAKIADLEARIRVLEDK